MCLFAFSLGILAQNIFFPSFFLLLFLSTDLKKLIAIFLCFACGSIYMWFHEWQKLPSIKDGFHQYQGQILNFPSSGKVLVALEILDNQKHRTKVWLDIATSTQQLSPGEIWQWQGRHWHAQQDFWYKDEFRHIEGHCHLVPNSLKRIKKISSWDMLHRMQLVIFNKAKTLFTDAYSKSLFLTLVLGLGSELDQEDWNLFKVTGTAHLMVVSGAHLSLLMTLVSGMIGLIWKIIYPLNLVLPRQKASSLIALLLGLVYALITGFSIPVKRAWLMMAMRWVHYFYPKRISGWQALRWSFVILEISEPHMLYYPATYLSYLAVVILMYGSLLPIKKRFLKALFLQLICVFGMGPLTILWFENIPLIGLVANFVAIPWVSWVLLPSGLFLALYQVEYVVKLFDVAALGLQNMLSYISQAQALNIVWHWPHAFQAMLILLIAAMVCWLPGLPMIGLGAISCILISIPMRTPIENRQFIVQILDVGQGLSVLVSTRSHHLLFDSATLAASKKVLIPYLQNKGIKTLDAIVISHNDADHCGGVDELKKNHWTKNWISSYELGKNCHLLPAWQWDGVTFEFLAIKSTHMSKNNKSCVLKVSNQKQSILLTGDIERQAEYQLIYAHRNKLASTVLLMPHHGSLTSSSYWFLDMVKPKLAVLSVALKNRYHLPNPEVLKRYQKMAIPYLSTAQQSKIVLYFQGNKLKTKSSWWQWLE